MYFMVSIALNTMLRFCYLLEIKIDIQTYFLCKVKLQWMVSLKPKIRFKIKNRKKKKKKLAWLRQLISDRKIRLKITTSIAATTKIKENNIG